MWNKSAGILIKAGESEAGLTDVLVTEMRYVPDTFDYRGNQSMRWAENKRNKKNEMASKIDQIWKSQVKTNCNHLSGRQMVAQYHYHISI